MRITVCSAFGPGRQWEVDLWRASLRRLEDSAPLYRVVILDNSGDLGTRHCLLSAYEGLGGPSSKAFLTIGEQVARRVHGPRVVADHIARVYNAMLAARGECDAVLFLEPDVSPPAGSLEELVAATGEDIVGIVGCPILSRTSRHLMVYNVLSPQPWELDRKHQPPRRLGPTQVDSVSVGYTLVMADLLDDFQFRGTPNKDGSGGNGHEWSLMKHCALSGRRVLCHWDIRPTHYLDAQNGLTYE